MKSAVKDTGNECDAAGRLSILLGVLSEGMDLRSAFALVNEAN